MEAASRFEEHQRAAQESEAEAILKSRAEEVFRDPDSPVGGTARRVSSSATKPCAEPPTSGFCKRWWPRQGLAIDRLRVDGAALASCRTSQT